jgi:hypothetical protein
MWMRMSTTVRGYIVWGIAGAIFAVPEIWASADSDLSFPTLSGTVGHLERRFELASLAVIVVIANALLHAVRVGIAERRAGDERGDTDTVAYGGTKHVAVEQGRVTRTASPAYPAWWLLYFPVTLGAIVLGFLVPLLVHGGHATDAEKQLSGEFGYGAMGLMFFVIPTILAWGGVLVPFPGLFRSVLDLERLFPPLAVAVAGCMTFLMLHLVLYPYPSIIPWFQDVKNLHDYCSDHLAAAVCQSKK